MKTKKSQKATLVCVAVLLALSCDLPDEAPFVRACLEAPWSAPLDIKVFVEGKTGNALDCANVVVVDPAGMSLLLAFDGNAGMYHGTIYDSPSGAYTVSVRSRSGSSNLQVPLRILRDKPQITSAMDSAGNSALQGEKLSSKETISFSWNAAVDAEVYVIRINSVSGFAFSATTGGTVFVLDPTVLAAGYYTVSIEAQSVKGDPLMRSSQYYSVSNAKGASFAFEIVP